jgi:hypothetical protein
MEGDAGQTMTRLTIAAALLALAAPAHAGALRIDTTDPFLDRLPKSAADFDRMYSAFTDVTTGETVGEMTIWTVIDSTHDEGVTAALMSERLAIAGVRRILTWNGHGYSLTVRENGVVVESSTNYADNMKLHTLRTGWGDALRPAVEPADPPAVTRELEKPGPEAAPRRRARPTQVDPLPGGLF